MNIPSKILTDAIHYVRNHPDSEPWFAVRDRSIMLCIRSIKAEVYNVDIHKRTIYIKITVDYVEQEPDLGTAEDLIIYLAWKEPNNFRLFRINAVPWA